MEPIFASISFYIYVISVCRLAVHYIRVKQLVSDANIPLVLEFFGSLQVCACCFENGAFLHFYGWPGFWSVLTVMAFVHALSIEAFANPAITIEGGIRGKTSWVDTAKLVGVQLAGGMLAYRFNLLFWSFGLHEVHAQKYETYACYTDLNVTLMPGIFFECLAATLAQFADCWLSRRYEQKSAIFALCATCATITCIGLHLTGMYYNPILASALTFGCEGLDNTSHWIVYWLGPCLGQYIGTEIHARVDNVEPDKIKIQ